MPGMRAQRRLDRIAQALDAPTASTLHQYQEDAVGYAHKVLGIRELTQDQVRVLRAIVKPRARVLVPSGNETGKSFLAAIICSWHYDCFYPSLTLTTAPSKAQVTDILFRELRRLRKGDPNFSPKADRLMESVDRLCIGYTAKDSTSFHGRHDASVLMVYDEAEGIDKEFWEATETFADRWVCFYNPTLANSEAAVQERKRTWDLIRMSAFTHPNVLRQLKGLPPCIPNAVTLPKVKQRLAKWATRTTDTDPNAVELDGVYYSLGPVAEARIAGRRPSKPVNSVYSESTLAQSLTPLPPDPSHPLVLAVDVARFGDDMSVIHARRGPVSIHHESRNGWDTVELARRVCTLCKSLGGDTTTPIVVDSIGVGGGVVDNIIHLGFNAVPVNTSRPSDVPEEYPNLRSQLYFDLKDLMDEGLVSLSGIEEDQTHDIHEQLRAASYSLDGRGRRVVEGKDRMKLTLGRSPDDADAVLLCYYQFPDTYEHS